MMVSPMVSPMVPPSLFGPIGCDAFAFDMSPLLKLCRASLDSEVVSRPLRSLPLSSQPSGVAVMPRRRSSSLMYMPDCMPSSSGRRYGTHDVIIVTHCTICVQSVHCQRWSVKSEDPNAEEYTSWTAVATISLENGFSTVSAKN